MGSIHYTLCGMHRLANVPVWWAYISTWNCNIPWININLILYWQRHTLFFSSSKIKLSICWLEKRLGYTCMKTKWVLQTFPNSNICYIFKTCTRCKWLTKMNPPVKKNRTDTLHNGTIMEILDPKVISCAHSQSWIFFHVHARTQTHTQQTGCYNREPLKRKVSRSPTSLCSPYRNSGI
jgi:hypothetical protein